MNALKYYLVEYTKGSAKKSHFEKQFAETPQRATDLFIDRTVNTYVVAVWEGVEWR